MKNVYAIYNENIKEIENAFKKQNVDFIDFEDKGYDNCPIVVTDLSGYIEEASATQIRINEKHNELEIAVQLESGGDDIWFLISEIPYMSAVETLDTAANILGIA